MNEQDFINVGFKEYPITPGMLKNADRFYQKCIRYENKRKLYFIDIFVYEYPPQMKMGLGYQIECQFELSNHSRFNVSYMPRTESTIEEVEAFFKDVYEKLNCIPYDD